MKMYGIKNCDTIKKAKKWLDDHGIAYEFHDYKKDGLSEAQLNHFVTVVGVEALINKRGTTYRQLDAAIKDNLTLELAKQVMLDNPSIIKRPLLFTQDDHFILGFSTEQYQTLL